MGFDWREYLTLAQELTEQKPPPLTPINSEARYRAAISRSYYAVHKLAAQYLEARGPYTPTIGIKHHAEVYNQFISGPTEQHTIFGNALLDLYDYRIKVDYKSDGKWLQPLSVKLIIASATGLLEDLENIKKLDKSSQVKPLL